MGGFLACDWGTTNLRCWVIDPAGRVGAARDFPLGIAVVGRDAPRRFHEDVRPAMGAEKLPALLCGMVGADLGWGGAGYRACPAGPEAMAGALVTVSPGVRIVPGLRCDKAGGGVDVMRGEETQVFGWLAADPARTRGRRLVCCPGTHSKWITVEDGVVTDFTTYMTGELYALVMTHSILRSDAPADDAAAFEAGLAAAGDGDGLAASLFSARARLAAGGADPATTSSYVSGVLIGAEVAAVAGLDAGAPAVDLIGAPALCRRYGVALERCGIAWAGHDGDAASLAGLVALHRQDQAASSERPAD